MIKKIRLIASFIGIPVVPYVFILLMGLLKKEGLITSQYSWLIVASALLLFGFMVYLSYRLYLVNKQTYVTASNLDASKSPIQDSDSNLDIDKNLGLDSYSDSDLEPDPNLYLDSGSGLDLESTPTPYLDSGVDDGEQKDDYINNGSDNDNEIDNVQNIDVIDSKKLLTNLLDRIEVFLGQETLTKEEIIMIEGQRERVIKDLIVYLVNEKIDEDNKNIMDSLNIINNLLSKDDLTDKQRESLLARKSLFISKPKEVVHKNEVERTTTYSKYGLLTLITIVGLLAYKRHKKINRGGILK